ncbi:glycosyltransferase family 2 protein [Spirosoma validum]|uniref:Glycosyltransferase n=1 Tax=Spirosoma validum TaxID=2771355 RepID=A0A927AZ72_9BACT|nr:glycosyltransferase family 2 protein [Spirosoma validum]MBD2752569.1 glycosyltransferase [Spirosoma validum]
MNTVAVSLITVNLNNKIGLEATINSVLNQSYKNYEFILIDGGSQDGSAELIEHVSDKLTYWVSEKDNGIYHAMNKGIQQAKGTYCLFLNSGDWLVNNAVLATVFSTSPTADMLIGRCRISENGESVFITKPSADLTLKSFIGNTLPHQATFIKTALFNRFGLYEEKYKINADFAFWIRAIVLGNCSIAALDVLISDYNLDGISSSIHENPDIHKEIPLILKEHFPERVLDDYRSWLAEKQDQSSVYFDWIKSKKYRYSVIKLVYKLSRRFTRAVRYVTVKKGDSIPAVE